MRVSNTTIFMDIVIYINMGDNIGEVIDIESLVKKLKENKDRFVILALTLKDTPDSEKTMLKRFLKSKYKNYPNITFIYYCAKEKDLGRISILKKDKSQYPYLYHIHNVTTLFVIVNNVTEQNAYESFSKVKEYYDNDKQKFLENINDKNDSNKKVADTKIKKASEELNDSDNDNSFDYDENEAPGDDDDEAEEAYNQEKKKEELQKQQIEQLLKTQKEMQYENKKTLDMKKIEQKKMFDKVVFMHTKAKEYEIQFAKDIANRKIKEYESKEKEQIKEAENKKSKNNKNKKKK